MDDIKQLASILQSKKLLHSKLKRGKDNTAKLYQLIVSDEVRTDQEGQEHLFKNSTAKQMSFNRLKNKLFYDMCNELILLNTNEGYSVTNREHINCHRLHTSFQILRLLGARKAAVHVGKRLLKKALKNQMTDLVISASVFLMNHNAIAGKRSYYKGFKDVYEKYVSIKQMELAVESIWGEIMIEYSTTKNSHTMAKQSIVDRAMKVRSLIKSEHTYRINYFCYNILLYSNHIRNDHQGVIDTCKEALQYLDSLDIPLLSSTFFTFNYHSLISSIVIGQYDQAKHFVEQCFQYAPTGARNWIITNYYQTILGFYSEDYELAAETIKKSIPHLSKHEDLRENYLILDAYIKILGKAKFYNSDLKKFRLAKFLNNVPRFSKDKIGVNINILIIQILSLLANQQHGKIIDKSESLYLYKKRYLKNEGTTRRLLFVSMLLQLEKGHFNPIAVQRHAKKYYDKLVAMPFSESTQDLEVEPVPYERLWEVVLGLLG